MYIIIKWINIQYYNNNYKTINNEVLCWYQLNMAKITFFLKYTVQNYSWLIYSKIYHIQNQTAHNSISFNNQNVFLYIILSLVTFLSVLRQKEPNEIHSLLMFRSAWDWSSSKQGTIILNSCPYLHWSQLSSLTCHQLKYYFPTKMYYVQNLLPVFAVHIIIFIHL